MDSLTQIALGAAVGEAVAGRRLGNRAMIAGAVFGTLPDLDIIVPFADAVASFTYHRSFSHSWLVLTALTPLLALLTIRFAPAVTFKRWCLLIFLALNTHVLLDCFTVYGTQALWPLSNYPIGWSTIFIIDPLYLLGTDSLGRDLLSRVIHGARIALTVAVLAAAFAAVLGTSLGLLAGYFGGWVDNTISRLVDIWMSFPAVLLSIVLVAVLGTGLHSVVIAIGIIDWTRFCRVVRAETQVQKNQDYVSAAKALGQQPVSILFTEVLPNIVPLLLTLFFLEMGIAVVVEAILSFVGLSLSSDTPTWGGLIEEGRQYVHEAWWVMLLPMLCILSLVIALNACGEGVRRSFDPVMHK